MKRFLILILTLMCFIVPTAAYGEDSPTPESLWHSEPALEFKLILDDDEAYEYLALISTYYDLEGFVEMVLDTDEYELVDMISITLDKTYKKVTWTTPYTFTTHDSICVFMVSTDLLQGYVMNARGNKNGDLVINYSSVAPGTYFMIIYVAD